jgi:hypothetical protein
VTGRWAGVLAAATALSCADEPVPVSQAPTALSASVGEVLRAGSSLAVVAVLDDGVPREVAITAGAQVSVRVYGATVARVAQPSGARPLVAGGRATLDLHTAITQLDPSGRAVGRIENPFADTPGRARLAAGRRVLAVLGDDVTDEAAWRVYEAYALDAAGGALAEPALGLGAGASVDALFAVPSSP